MDIIKVDDIHKHFPIRRGPLRQTVGFVKAVDGVTFAIGKGEVFGLVGESGCGKTTVGRLILSLVTPDAGSVTRNVGRVNAVFQDPYASLDPLMRIRETLFESLRFARRAGDMRAKAVEALGLVRLPETALDKYPHQFSGGERQRIAIARALVNEPEFIVCDEPVSSLDASIQLEILDLLKSIHRERGLAMLFISHDMRAVRYLCQRVAVMREGKVVEAGTAEDICARPAHPYARELISSVRTIYARFA